MIVPGPCGRDLLRKAQMATNWVYILTNKERGSFYIGSTSDPAVRLSEHRTGNRSKHVRKYNLYRVVWFKAYQDKETALTVEHRIKRKSRDWKFAAIEEMNPNWDDLTEQWLEAARQEWG